MQELLFPQNKQQKSTAAFLQFARNKFFFVYMQQKKVDILKSKEQERKSKVDN